MLLGLRADGSRAIDFYRPSALDFASHLIWSGHPPDGKAVDYARDAPLPRGLSLVENEKELAMDVIDVYAVRYRRLSGYIGGVKFQPEDDKLPITTETPALLQAAVKIWRKYCSLPADAHDSFEYCRVLAFMINAAFDSPTASLRVSRSGIDNPPIINCIR